MESQKVDLAVIGAGPAGQKGAIQGAKAGMQVVVVDRLGLLGGACLNQGTIPSKTLRRAILDMTGFAQSAYFGDEGSSHKISVEDLRARISKVIDDENTVLQQQCENNGIAIAFGTARFAEAPNVLEVLDRDGQVRQRIEADKILIATGSRPRHPIDRPEEGELFVDSDLVFQLPRLPAEASQVALVQRVANLPHRIGQTADESGHETIQHLIVGDRARQRFLPQTAKQRLKIRDGVGLVQESFASGLLKTATLLGPLAGRHGDDRSLVSRVA